MSIPPANFGLRPPSMPLPPGLPAPPNMPVMPSLPPGIHSPRLPPPGVHPVDMPPRGSHPLDLPLPRMHRMDVAPPGMPMLPPPEYSRHLYPPDLYGPPCSTYLPMPTYQNYPSSMPPQHDDYSFTEPIRDHRNYPPYFELPQGQHWENQNVAAVKVEKSSPSNSSFDYFGTHKDSFYSSKDSFSKPVPFAVPKVKQEKWDPETMRNLKSDRSLSSSSKMGSLSRQFDREREHRDKSPGIDNNRERDRHFSRERDRYRSRESERNRSRSRERYRHRSRENERDRPRSRERDRYRSRESDRHRSRESERDRYYRDRHDDYERERRHFSLQRHSKSSSRSHDRYDRSSSRLSSRSESRSQHSRESSSRHERKPMTDREKILAEFRKNYCRTSDDFIERLQQWSKENNLEEEEGTRMWYRSSPAELYYKRLEGQPGVQQSKKLEALVEKFTKELIERGRNARPAVDEMPPLQSKTKLCSHKNDDKSSSSEESSEEGLTDEDEAGLESDRIVQELQRKQNHPRRLHSEMWFNNAGEMNSGPLCRCSARARRFGMRHGVYAGEQTFPKCVPTESNIDKLYHYRITVSPPTNFLIKSPTIIAHDEHEFLFSGFSMFSHYKLAELPTCKVIRFNIEYTILYVEEPAPENFTVQELDLFQEFIFTELLELVDLDLGKPTETSCSQFHFMPRFVRFLPEGGCEVLSMCEVMKYLVDESGLLIDPEKLESYHKMDHYHWQKFVDRIKGMIVTYPGKKPCSVRVDQLDRSPPVGTENPLEYYPEIVHFGIRPPQLSYAGSPEYQKRWRFYVKFRHLIANMAKPTYKDRRRLAAREAKLQEMRTQTKMKRDVTVAISSQGFHTTGLMCDIVQHAMLIPVLIRHLRFHKSLDSLENKIGYVFKQRTLLQTALTHPSYRENFGTNPDHARNSLTNCGIRQPEYGDRRIHYTRKKGIVTLINIMSRFGRNSETESEIKHNERLEFLGDAVVEFISSIHLFKMFPSLAEGGLATYRASIVQNQHLAHLARNIELEKFMLYAHGSDLCREVVMKHAMANCFEALMGALFLDAGLEVADRVFALSLWHEYPDLYDTWVKERMHPLQEQEPLGDRKYIKDFEFLQKLTEFEASINVEFKHIRLLARAFTDRSVGFTHLTLGSNQRLEFLGDTVLQLVVSDRLYRHFPDHHEGHLSLLRSSLVNNRTQSMVCDDLNLSEYAIYNNPKSKPSTKKHKADLLEAFLGALFIDRGLQYCQAFCNACLFPRLQEFIMNQDWNDPKSKLQQCCLTLRSMEGGEPDIPLYKVIECLGPTNTRVYTVGVYFRGTRLASARGHSIQEAEMHAAEMALSNAHELFPQLDHQKRVIAKSTSKRKRGETRKGREISLPALNDNVPKAYRIGQEGEQDSSGESVQALSDAECNDDDKSDEDSGLDSDAASLPPEKLDSIEVSSLLNDMEKIKADMIVKNQYEKLKEKCRRSDSDDDS